MKLINLNSVTKAKNGRKLYVLPGCVTTPSAYHALDVLMEIRDLTARTIEARKAREKMKVTRTKNGAIITRIHSGNERYFLGA